MPGNRRRPEKAGPWKMPFQMPARLADGLGLESDLDGSDKSGLSFAPILETIRGPWFPRIRLRKVKPDLGCKSIIITKTGRCQRFCAVFGGMLNAKTQRCKGAEERKKKSGECSAGECSAGE